MTLICFASQKGSPGTTLTALSVAASFPIANGRRKILLEADCTGGTLALRYQLPTEPGLLTLAAAIRSSLDNELLWQHSQELPGGLSIVACPDGPDQVYAALAASGRSLGRWLEALPDVDVICDVGRLTPNSPSIDFVAEASAVLMVARPNVEQLQPAARRMISLAPVIDNLGWVLIGDSPYGPAEVESTYGLPVVGVIADDSRAAGKLESGVVSSKLVRSPLVRSAGSLAEVLAQWLRPNGVAPMPPQPDPEAPHQVPHHPPVSGNHAPQPMELALPPNPPDSWGDADTIIGRPQADAPHPTPDRLEPPPPPSDFGIPPSSPSQPPHPLHSSNGGTAWDTPIGEADGISQADELPQDLDIGADGSLGGEVVEFVPLGGAAAEFDLPDHDVPEFDSSGGEVVTFASPNNDVGEFAPFSSPALVVDDFFAPDDDEVSEPLSPEPQWNGSAGHATQQFEILPTPDTEQTNPVSDGRSSDGPPLPPSFLSLPEPPDDDELPAAELTDDQQLPQASDLAESEVSFVDGVSDRPGCGPVAEFDEVDEWVFSAAPAEEQSSQAAGAAQPIAEWILEPADSGSPNIDQPVDHESSDLEACAEVEADEPDAVGPDRPSVSTAIANGADKRQRRDWSGLRNAKTWQRSSTTAKTDASVVPADFKQAPSIIGAGESSPVEVVAEDEVIGYAELGQGLVAPDPFPHDDSGQGWTAQ